MALFLLALVLRLAFVWVGPGIEFEPSGDQVDYHELAASLARGDGYVLNGADGLPYATAFRPPLFPVALAPAYAIFGPRPLVGLVLEAIWGALLVVALWALGRRLWDETTGRLAGLGAACYPLLIFFSGILLSETLFSLLLVLAAFPLAYWWQKGGAYHAFLAGLILGMATLVRPTAPAWAGLLCLLAFVLRLRPLKPLSKEILVMALGGALLVLPWSIRNTNKLGSFVPLTTGGGCALYDGNNPYVVDNPEFHGGAWSLRNIEPYASEFSGLTELEIDRLSLRRAIEFWKQNPGRIPQLVLWKQLRFWRASSQAGGTGWWMSPSSPAARLAARLDPLLLSYGLMLPFLLVGVWSVIRRPREGGFVLLAAVAAQAVLASIYWGSLRFRVPIEPFLVLLAAHGVLVLWRTWGQRARRRSGS